jgi:hypothetical protein
MQTRNVTAVILACLLATCLLAACSGDQTGGTPSAGEANAPSLPTWTPASPGSTAAVVVPYGDSITTAELEARLDPFGSPDCMPPCYNGLVPGHGGLQEALQFYARLGISALDMQPGDYDSVQDGTGNLGAVLTRSSDILQTLNTGFAPPHVDLRLSDNVVRYVNIKWDGIPAYIALSRVLANMGQPDRLDLGLIFGGENPEFVIQLTYSTSQTGFAYFGDAPSDGSQLQVCLSPDHMKAALMGTYAPDEALMAGFSHEKYLLPIQDTLGLSFDDFVAQANAGGCLTIPSSQWDAWQTLGN